MTIRNRIKGKEYRAGVKSCIEFAMANVGLGVDIWCPCVDCMNAKKQSTEVVKIHLILRGISISYKTWVQHGESVPVHRLCVSNEDACFHSKSSRDSVEGNNIKDGEELPNMVGEAQMLRVREESSQSVVRLTPEEMSWEEEEAHTRVRGWPKSSSSSTASESDAASPRLDEEFLKLKADMEKMQVEREVERRAREEEKREREMERRAHEVGQKKMADLMSLVTQLIQEKKQAHSSSIH